MDYEKVLGEHKFPTYEELKTGLIRLIDEGKISREDASRLLPELRESEDERIRKAVVSLVYEMKGTYQSFAKVELDQMVAWLEKQKEQKPAEWSEEDENKIESIKGLITMGRFADTNTIRTIWELLDSLRPSWKPREEHLSALLAVFNDPNNIGSQTCQLALTDLYEQLKKL